MIAAASWWNRNGVMLQTLATLALIIVTAVYVLVTAKISSATKEQAEAARRQAAAAEAQVQHGRDALVAEQSASEAQLTQMRAALDAQKEIARQADAHAQSVLIESAKARLSSLTPICSILWAGSPLTQRDGGSIGNVSMDVFERGATMVVVRFTVRNDSPHPALVTAMPVDIDDEDLSELPDWTSTVRSEVLLGGNQLELAYRIVGPGSMFARWAADHRKIQFEFDTISPISGVTDHHTWTGTFPSIEHVVGSGATMFDHNANSGFFGSRAAFLMRLWPAGFGEN